MMRIVTFKLEEEWLEKLDKVAKYLNKSRSEVIRIALRQFLSEPIRRPHVKRIRVI